jgi:TolB protein
MAWPWIQDLTPGGGLGVLVEQVSNAINSGLNQAGAFRILPRGTVPETGAITWASEAGFDYEGWRKVGAWIVVVGELSASPAGIRVRLDAYLTEEGRSIRFRDAEAILPADRLTWFANHFVNALLECVTGVPGSYGTRIAYTRKPDPRTPKEVWWVEFGGRDQVQASHDGSGTMLPAWAPGGRLAWTGFRNNSADVFLDGAPFSTRPGQNSGIAFSPDGRLAALTLAPEGNADIWLLDARTGDEVARLTATSRIDTSPAWSPDGRRIAFVSDRHGGPQIFIMSADGSDPYPLPLPGSYNTSPDWSPDGREIVYQSRGERARFSIWTYNLATGVLQRLTGGPWNDEEPSWSPDGRLIVFTSTRHGRKQLWVLHRNGRTSPSLLLDDEGDYFTPAWERATGAWGRTGPGSP